MSAKLTQKEESRIRAILLDAAIEIIEAVNDAIDTAYKDGFEDGRIETEKVNKL